MSHHGFTSDLAGEGPGEPFGDTQGAGDTRGAESADGRRSEHPDFGEVFGPSRNSEPELVQLLTPEGERLHHPVFDQDFDAETLRGFYRDMVLVRRIDTEATALQRHGELGLWAQLLGQEAAQIGAGRAEVEVASGPMMVVGVLGLAANLVALALLKGGAAESINVKGAYLEVLADTLGSVGVIVAGLLVLLTGDSLWDTLVALAIALFVLVRAWFLGREVVAVLGQHSPPGVVPSEVEAALAQVPGVSQVHDLHLWCLTSGMNVATAHLVAAPGRTDEVLAAAAQLLREQFDVEHATLQVESADHECHRTDW